MGLTTTRFFRKAILVPLISCFFLPARAQVSSYIFTQSATNYTPLSGGTVVAQATGSAAGQRLNDGNAAVTLPFSFNFNGTAYSTLNVNANGYITFGATTPATNLTTPVSSATGYSGAVAALGTDIEGVNEVTVSMQMGSTRLTSVSRLNGLKPGQTVMGNGIPAGTTISSIANGSVILSNPAGINGTGVVITAITGIVSTQTLGTAPNRTFVIQWEGFKQAGILNSVLNFQIQLAEAGGVANAQTVSVVYGPCMAGGASNAEIGLRGASNADYNNRAGSNNFTNTTAGAANSAVVSFNASTPIPAGLMLSWSRQALASCNGTPAAGNAIASSASSCSGSLVLMSPGAATGTGITYQWQRSATATSGYTDITGATTNPYTATSANASVYYRLNVKCGVSNITTSSGFVGVSNDQLNVNLGNDTTLCPGDVITLDAGFAGSNYLWSTSGTSQEVSILNGGTYTVTVTDPVSGCSGTDAITVNSGQIPVVNLGNDRAICQGTSVVLNAGNTGASFLWNTGANTQTINVNRAGTFAVRVINTDRCVNTDTINITIDPLPSVGFISYNGVMPTISFSVSSAANVAAYLWDFDDNGATSAAPSPTHTFTHSGNFNVRVIVSNNCGTDTSSETVHITGAGIGGTRLDPGMVSAYPNPASQYVLLESRSNLRFESIQVVNMLGAVVLEQQGSRNGTARLETAALPAGTYLVRIMTDRGMVMKKVQVTR